MELVPLVEDALRGVWQLKAPNGNPVYSDKRAAHFVRVRWRHRRHRCVCVVHARSFTWLLLPESARDTQHRQRWSLWQRMIPCREPLPLTAYEEQTCGDVLQPQVLGRALARHIQGRLEWQDLFASPAPAALKASLTGASQLALHWLGEMRGWRVALDSTGRRWDPAAAASAAADSSLEALSARLEEILSMHEMQEALARLLSAEEAGVLAAQQARGAHRRYACLHAPAVCVPCACARACPV